MKTKIAILILIFLVFGNSSVNAYEIKSLEKFDALFSKVSGAKAGKELHLVTSEAFVKNIKNEKKYMVLDIRTPAETDIFGIKLQDTLVIPAEILFKKENIDKIKKDIPVMVICQTGARSLAVGTALRLLGFDNIYILKGGFKALSAYLGPKQAN